MCAHVQGLLYQYPMAPCLPVVQPLLDPLSNLLGCGDLIGLLQDHRLKDDEPLRVPQSVPHPAQLFHQVHHKVSPDLPAWRVIAPLGHDRKVMPPPLPGCLVPDSVMNVGARVGVLCHIFVRILRFDTQNQIGTFRGSSNRGSPTFRGLQTGDP